ncbi:excinuclease ABC subunit C [Constrictibacter sp. MBR-5]|jgi:excinuclease ABC subunit C|uniref:excinuclease ABC subunit UvrC n=1 Tax=Constrictibacter sp. MBR-5 TaxID=3156467 RepID=UPI0033946D82
MGEEQTAAPASAVRGSTETVSPHDAQATTSAARRAAGIAGSVAATVLAPALPRGDPDRPLASGVELLRAQIRHLPMGPGVYRMSDARGTVLYVGKAASLRKRVVAYTHPERLPNRLRRMVAETAALEIVQTHTEVEALLLEINLIKRLKPRYNVLLRDDKSFPHILLTGDTDWPQVTKHRGARTAKGDYFGPFASAGAVNRTLTALQRAFLLRSCSDAIFNARTRPCLLHQIKRCSAPCVGRISREDYAGLVDQAHGFLKGESQTIQQTLSDEMQAASEAMDFESAALYRDRIRALAHVQSHQEINVEGLGDADVVALHQEGGQACVQVFFFRGGQNFGNHAYFPTHVQNLEPDEVLAGFVGQFYSDRPPPRLVLISHPVAEIELLTEALALQAGHAVRIERPQRGHKRKLIERAELNAREALGRRVAESAGQARLLAGVADAFGLGAPPQRIEVYDNSHIGGTMAVGGMIVAGPEGLMKGAYRKFNIRSAGTAANLEPGEITPGDDYGMMREVLNRRFARALKEDPDRSGGSWPDLVLIDGGLGQLNAARKVFEELGIADLALVAIAKGPDRDAGRERFFIAGREPFMLPPNDPTLYFLQRLRDEAHRFAIGTHRARRTKAIGQSTLDEIAGIGAARKRALLHHFGSAKGVSRAGLTDLEAVPGISSSVAKKVYDHFHPQG